MQIDRAEFLRMASLIFSVTAACGSTRAPAPAPAPPATPELTEVEPGPLENHVAGPPPPGDPLCDNHRGSLQICRSVSPTCEGLRAECQQLTEDLVPRVAEAWATCFANAKTGCRGKALGACMQRAVDHACVELGAVATCEALIAKCAAAQSPARYSLEQCTKIVSAVKPGGPGKWREVDEERMGPGPSQEACSLEYVLPYQPYGWMWR